MDFHLKPRDSRPLNGCQNTTILLSGRLFALWPECGERSAFITLFNRLSTVVVFGLSMLLLNYFLKHACKKSLGGSIDGAGRTRAEDNGTFGHTK